MQAVKRPQGPMAPPHPETPGAFLPRPLGQQERKAQLSVLPAPEAWALLGSGVWGSRQLSCVLSEGPLLGNRPHCTRAHSERLTFSRACPDHCSRLLQREEREAGADARPRGSRRVAPRPVLSCRPLPPSCCPERLHPQVPTLLPPGVTHLPGAFSVHPDFFMHATYLEGQRKAS